MKYLSLLFILTFTFQVSAASFQLPELSKSDLEASSKEFLGNFTHTSVSPPGRLGAIFGFEVGAVGGITDAPETGKLIKEVDSDSEIDSLPHAGLLGRVGVPFGLTFEGLIVPEQKTDSAEFSHLSLGVQWDFLRLPLFDLAVKAHYGTSDFSFDQKIQNDANGNVTFDNSTYGAMGLIGADLLVFNPYAGLGFVKGNSELAVEASGSNNLFKFTDSKSVDVDETSVQYLVGAQLELLLINVAAEYSHQFGTDRISGKLTFGF